MRVALLQVAPGVMMPADCRTGHAGFWQVQSANLPADTPP